MIGSVAEYQAQLAAQARQQAACKAGIPGLEAQPGPGAAAAPGDISPEQFRRGYEHPGHAAPSPQSGPACDYPAPEGPPAAEDFTRPYQQAGHAAESPAVRDSGMPQHNLSPVAGVNGSGPGADAIRAHMARYSTPSPSERGGR